MRAIRLLELREMELRDEMKNILELMAASAEALQQGATSSSSPLALAAARLERCVLPRRGPGLYRADAAARRAYSGERAPEAVAEPEAAGTTVDTTECTVQHPGALCCTRCVARDIVAQARRGLRAGRAFSRPQRATQKPNYPAR